MSPSWWGDNDVIVVFQASTRIVLCFSADRPDGAGESGARISNLSGTVRFRVWTPETQTMTSLAPTSWATSELR